MFVFDARIHVHPDNEHTAMSVIHLYLMYHRAKWQRNKVITQKRHGSLYMAGNDRKVFSLPLTKVDKCHVMSCQNVCDALSYLLDNIYIRFGTKLYRQIDGIPMGTNCALLIADLF